MATATKKVDVAASLDRASRAVPEAASPEFRSYLDERGGYSWEIVDGGGESLARSASFASQDDPARAARCVYEGVGSTRFELDAPKERETVAA